MIKATVNSRRHIVGKTICSQAFRAFNTAAAGWQNYDYLHDAQRQAKREKS
jgi:hypothetical protein